MPYATLREPRSYTIGGMTFIQDQPREVPQNLYLALHNHPNFDVSEQMPLRRTAQGGLTNGVAAALACPHCGGAINLVASRRMPTVTAGPLTNQAPVKLPEPLDTSLTAPESEEDQSIGDVVDTLDIDNEENFDADGKPSLLALSRALGRDVTAEEREQALRRRPGTHEAVEGQTRTRIIKRPAKADPTTEGAVSV